MTDEFAIIKLTMHTRYLNFPHLLNLYLTLYKYLSTYLSFIQYLWHSEFRKFEKRKAIGLNNNRKS